MVNIHDFPDPHESASSAPSAPPLPNVLADATKRTGGAFAGPPKPIPTRVEQLRPTGLETGKQATKGAYATIRGKSERGPMRGRKRRSNHVRRYFSTWNKDVGSLEEIERASVASSAGNPGSEKRQSEQSRSYVDQSGAHQYSQVVLRSRSSSSLRQQSVGQHGRLQVRASVYRLDPNQMDVESLEISDGESSVQDSAQFKGHAQNYTQFRLNAKKSQSSIANRFLLLFGITAGHGGIYDDADEDDGCKCFGVAPNQLVTRYLRWTFRRSFLAVFFSAAVGFFSLTMAFAVLIFLAGFRHPECLHVNGVNFNNFTDATFGANFADAYSLSWTTFSTVGYGLVYPSTSSVHENQIDCVGISVLCTVESFVGILFASFCGAIMFGKVARIRSHAQVVFSDVIVVKFGTGVMGDLDDDDRSALSMSTRSIDSGPRTTCLRNGDDRRKLSRNLPCPVLEFRVANRLHQSIGGEIMDASMNIVASVDHSQASLQNGKAGAARRRKGKRIGGKPTNKKKKMMMMSLSGISESNEHEAQIESLRQIADSVRENAKGQHPAAFDEDSDGKLIPRRIFAKVEIEAPDHPFFKRVWFARHILNEDSPLLTEEARRAIHVNGGFWPEEMNDYEFVRAAIQFDQILVSLSGTSNVDANSVYAQQVYDYGDMNIGYRFANILYRDSRDGSVKVDTTKINDVSEQAGGGGEPLKVADQRTLTDLLVL